MELEAHKPVFLLGIASTSQGFSDIVEAHTEHAKYSPHSCHLISPYQHYRSWLIPSHMGRPKIILVMQFIMAGEDTRIICHPFPIYPLALEDSILIISYIYGLC